MKKLSIILTVILALFLAGCGEDENETTITIDTKNPPTTPSDDTVDDITKAELTVSLFNIGSKDEASNGMKMAGNLNCTRSIPATCNAQITCPAKSDDWQKEACNYLTQTEGLFTPVDPEQMCTEIYGGPEQATITGTVGDETIQVDLDRTNGCQISQWDLHSKLWGASF